MTRIQNFSWLAAAIVASAVLSACSAVRTEAPIASRPELVFSSRGVDGERLQRLDASIESYVDEGRLASAIVHVLRDGRPVFSRAYGWRDREARDPATPDTIYRIASQTKAVTTVAAMMLVEDGKLLLDDPVGKFLPEWSRTTVAAATPGGGFEEVPAKRAITIRDLMTHTAGISYGTGLAEQAWREAGIVGWYFADRAESVRGVVKRMAALPMAEQPGERFVYGYSTDVLGAVVEKITGQSLERVLRERLFETLEMTDTYFCLPREKANRLAVVYSMTDGDATRAPTPGTIEGISHVGQGHHVDGPCVAYSGGAGLVSTAIDYGRFLEMLRNGGALGGTRYLSRKSVELMTRNQLGSVEFQSGFGFSLGFRVVEDVGTSGQYGSEGSYGWGGAYHSVYWVDPIERLTVVFLTNIIPAGDLDVHGRLRALVYAALE